MTTHTDWSGYSLDIEIALRKMDQAAALNNWAEAAREASLASDAANGLCLWFAKRIADG